MAQQQQQQQQQQLGFPSNSIKWDELGELTFGWRLQIYPPNRYCDREVEQMSPDVLNGFLDELLNEVTSLTADGKLQGKWKRNLRGTFESGEVATVRRWLADGQEQTTAGDDEEEAGSSGDTNNQGDSNGSNNNNNNNSNDDSKKKSGRAAMASRRNRNRSSSTSYHGVSRMEVWQGDQDGLVALQIDKFVLIVGCEGGHPHVSCNICTFCNSDGSSSWMGVSEDADTPVAVVRRAIAIAKKYIYSQIH